MIGIISLSLAPLRTHDSEQSEMCSQLLYGERMEILETKERWLYVRNLSDNYEGWIDRKMVHLLDAEDEKKMEQITFKYIQIPISNCEEFTYGRTVLLPGGSNIPYHNGEQFHFGGKTVQMNHADIVPARTTGERIVHLAEQYLNAPYLWGGKSILGIDCSGLVQVVYSMCGIQLPRDASQQVEAGKEVKSLTEAQVGDLAFFKNAAGKITHVGILLGSCHIIHASGWVKIESIDSQGILSVHTGGYTHSLDRIKRII